jgi:NAD(P)-dependent dehydrogenase (short-subunit alcohol dehydrogenase family)
MRLKDRVALVTGGSRGIGRGIALAFAREGAAVVVSYRQSEAQAEETVAEARRAGGRAVAVQADVANLDQHERLIAAAREHFGRLDVLVNNAGIGVREPFLEAKPETWDHIFGVNLKGAYFLSQRVAQIMARGRAGKIINISSVHDVKPMPNNSIYNISKAALLMMTKSLALELAASGVCVNAISPGAIYTDATKVFLTDDAYHSKVLQKIPAGRIGTVEDLAGAAVLLASPDSDYITGTVLYVDGGMVLQ